MENKSEVTYANIVADILCEFLCELMTANTTLKIRMHQAELSYGNAIERINALEKELHKWQTKL